jgi:hypothetical protein
MEHTDIYIEKISDPELRAKAYLELAQLFRQLENIQKAVTNAKQAALEAENIIYQKNKDQIRNSIVQTLLEFDQTNLALEVSEKIIQPTLKAQTLCNISLTLARKRQGSRALKVANELFDMAETISDPTEKPRVLIYSSINFARLKENYKAVITLVDAIFSTGLADQATFFQTLKVAIPYLSTIDNCKTLYSIHESLVELDTWWSIE